MVLLEAQAEGRGQVGGGFTPTAGRRPDVPTATQSFRSGWRAVFFHLLAERYHARNHPLVPGLVDLVLEVGDVVVGEVGEAPLLEQVVAHRQALEAAVGDVPRLADQPEGAVLHLPER